MTAGLLDAVLKWEHIHPDPWPSGNEMAWWFLVWCRMYQDGAVRVKAGEIVSKAEMV